MATVFFFHIHCTNSSNDAAAQLMVNTGNSIQGKAVKILDGDTFDLLLPDKTVRRIRLYGIDCPERKQPYYQAAKDFLGHALQSANILVTIRDKDRYGRTVGVVLANHQNINEALLRAGLGWHYRRYDRNLDWSDLEKEARRKHAGLWADLTPIPPWAFKHPKTRKR